MHLYIVGINYKNYGVIIMEEIINEMKTISDCLIYMKMIVKLEDMVRV